MTRRWKMAAVYMCAFGLGVEAAVTADAGRGIPVASTVAAPSAATVAAPVQVPSPAPPLAGLGAHAPVLLSSALMEQTVGGSFWSALADFVEAAAAFVVLYWAIGEVDQVCGSTQISC